MITHHCSECGEEVAEFCDAHPKAIVDSVKAETTETLIQAELVRLGVASSDGCEGLDVVEVDGTPEGYVAIADTETTVLQAAATLAALRAFDGSVSDAEIAHEGSRERAVWCAVWDVLNDLIARGYEYAGEEEPCSDESTT